MNAAIISYVVDILILDNIIGYGGKSILFLFSGFIYNETLIFIVNAILPPLIWIIDPWLILKKL
jgi:hypothetical protein